MISFEEQRNCFENIKIMQRLVFRKDRWKGNSYFFLQIFSNGWNQCQL